MGSLTGKVAIVTGSGSGIGEGEAYALAKEGAKVVVLARTLANVERVAENIKKLGAEALALKCDVSVESDVENAVNATLKTFGRIDILVNNAQVMQSQRTAIEDWTEEAMRITWESGYLGSWLFMKAVFPHMKATGGRIINTVSPAGHGIMAGFVGYGSTKEAIRCLTRTAARDWGQYNITVNAISPNALSEAAAQVFDTEEKQKAILKEMGLPIPRFGDPEKDAGRVVVFLAGPDASLVTGCTLSADGGCGMI